MRAASAQLRRVVEFAPRQTLCSSKESDALRVARRGARGVAGIGGVEAQLLDGPRVARRRRELDASTMSAVRVALAEIAHASTWILHYLRRRPAGCAQAGIEHAPTRAMRERRGGMAPRRARVRRPIRLHSSVLLGASLGHGIGVGRRRCVRRRGGASLGRRRARCQTDERHAPTRPGHFVSAFSTSWMRSCPQ